MNNALQTCPICHNQRSLIVTQTACSCMICGYYDSAQFYTLHNTVKIPSDEEFEIYQVNELAQNYFKTMLQTSYAMLTYLKQREYSPQEIKTYEYGYDDGKLINYLVQAGFSIPTLEKAGLVRGNIDFFSQRLIIPIRDNAKRLIGFAGRSLSDDQVKYINSPETPVFQKKATLFGTDKIDFQKKYLILCEGFFDVNTLQKHHYNAIASMGTALTIQHVLLLKQLNKHIYCLYDNDGAGRKATIQNMKLLQSYGVPCTYVSMQPCKDPDEFLTKFSTEELNNRLNHSKSRKQCFIGMTQPSVSNMKEFVDFMYETQKKTQ